MKDKTIILERLGCQQKGKIREEVGIDFNKLIKHIEDRHRG